MTILGVIVLAAVVALRTFSSRRSPARTAESITSVAVLPLANLSGRPDNEYLADGLALNVTNSLAKHPRLRVVSRTSAFAFKGQNRDVREIARALNVTSIVEGTLHLSGTTLQVSVQLTNAKGFSEWSDIFERELTDLSSIESAISGAIIDKLVPASPMAVTAVLGKPLSANPQAYDLSFAASTRWPNDPRTA